MRGNLKLGTIGLAAGLMLAVAAPTDARAVTSINISGQNVQFPDSVVGTPAIPQGGVLVSFSQVTDFTVLTNPFLGAGENGSADNGFVGTPQPLNLAVAFSGTDFALQLQQGVPVQNGVVNNANGVLPGSGPRAVAGNGGVEAGSGPREVGGDGDTVGAGSGPRETGAAPEPATWIMMMAGFWIVAWRMRKRGRRHGGQVPAHA